MGCCCLPRQEISQDYPVKENQQADSRQQIYKLPDYRQIGKKHFQLKKYKQAIENFTKANKIQPSYLPNYTNLALAYRAQKQYGKSIQIINHMMSLPGALNIKTQDLQFIVKGYILRSRSQTYLVKEYCFKGNLQLRGSQADLMINKVRIQEAQNCLLKILSTERMRPIAQKLKAELYLETTKKVHNYFKEHFLLEEKEDGLVKYFKKRLKSESAENGMQKFEGLFNNPNEVLDDILKIITQKKRKQLDEEEDEDYIIDPITYDQFQDPIIVPSGQTYESAVIKEHYGKNGTSDPITHQEFKNELGVHNRNLLKYINQTRKGISKDDLNYIDY